MANTIIESLREYFFVCPLLGNGRLNIDYLPPDIKQCGVEYSIDTTPTEEIVQRFIDGSSIRRYLFTFSTVNAYGPDVLQNMANSGFFEKLSDWMEKQTRAKTLPALPSGLRARKLIAMSTGYLIQSSGAMNAKYQIQCKLEYFKKGER